MHRTLRYDISKFTDCKDADGNKILAFSIRTTDGEDETHASKQAEARGTGMTEELIRFSIVSYEIEDTATDPANGTEIKAAKTVDVKQPFTSFDKWSTKVRNFVVAAWKRLSTPDEDEIKSFFASATEIG